MTISSVFEVKGRDAPGRYMLPVRRALLQKFKNKIFDGCNSLKLQHTALDKIQKIRFLQQSRNFHKQRIHVLFVSFQSLNFH